MTSTTKMPLPPLTLIFASTPSMGIGLRGSLPWPSLKKEMAFFRRVTTRPPPYSTLPKVNAVIMGRKTWESIPAKFRPLKDRINVVVTRRPELFMGEVGLNVLAVGSIREALEALKVRGEGRMAAGDVDASQQDGKALPLLGHVFVIGGAEIYAAALQTGLCERMLWTRIEKEYECDVFLPVGLGAEEWVRSGREEMSMWIGEEVLERVEEEGVEEEGVEFEFTMWERKRKNDGAAKSEDLGV